MPVLHKCAQYSDEYDRLRLGLPTSSNFDKIITPGGKPSKQWEKYAYHLIAERFLDRKIDTFTSRDMELGLMMEQDAANDYELMTDRTVDLIGFITNDEGTAGCSPDRLIGEDGLLEIKCPKPQTQMEYLVTGKVDKEHWPQLQGQLYISGRKFVDIMAFNPELPRCILTVERDVEFIACLEKQLKEFNAFIDQVVDKISEMQPIRKGAKYGKTEISL